MLGILQSNGQICIRKAPLGRIYIPFDLSRFIGDYGLMSLGGPRLTLLCLISERPSQVVDSILSERMERFLQISSGA